MTPGSLEASDDGSSEPVRVSSDEVLRELELLREGTGLSPQRIREKAPLLQSLAIVSDQMDLERFHPNDTHLAAYSAIGCVIEHAIRDYQYQQILLLTLRYDPSLLSLRRDAAAWEEIGKAPTVSQRDALTQALLVYGKSVYFVKRKNAYAELADQLAMRTRTPCRDSQAAQVARTTAALTFRQILGYLTVEGRDIMREVLAEEALLQLQDDWKPTLAGATSAAEALQGVIQRALSEKYPAAKAELTQLRWKQYPRTRHDQFYLEAELLSTLLGQRDFESFWRILMDSAANGYESTHEESMATIDKLAESIGLLVRIVARRANPNDGFADSPEGLGSSTTLDSTLGENDGNWR